MSHSLTKVGDVADILSGYAFDSDGFNTSSKGMPVIRIRDVVRGHTETFYKGEYDKRYIVSNGDILIGMDGEFNLGVWNGGRALLNQRVCMINLKEEMLNKHFLKHFLPTELKKIEDKTPFVTVKHLSTKKLANIKIPLPSLEEQKRIAAILDKADDIRRKRAESLKLLNELLRATFLDMFGDPIANPKGWPTQKFEAFGTIDRGKSKHRPRDAKELYGGKYPFIQTGDVANCGGYITAYKQTYSDCGLKQSRLWPANTLCITIAANIAKTGILTFDACFPDSVVGFTPTQPYYLEYIRFVLNFLQPLLEKQAPQSAQKNINLEILSRLKFPIPTKDLLEKFAIIEKKIMKSNQSSKLIMTESDTLFHSLVERAFKGKL